MFALGLKIQNNTFGNLKISQLIVNFIVRVESDNGIVESSNCIEKSLNYI